MLVSPVVSFSSSLVRGVNDQRFYNCSAVVVLVVVVPVAVRVTVVRSEIVGLCAVYG